MALGIILMNARSWETLVLITIKVILIRTAGKITYQIKFNSPQENDAIVNHLVGEILLNETQKLSSAREAKEFLESDYHENDIYQV